MPKDSKESSAEPQQAPARKVPMDGDLSRMVVRWVGLGNTRTITEKDWKTVGIEHPQAHWERDAPLNDVPVSAFDLAPHEFQRCIVADRDFRIVRLED